MASLSDDVEALCLVKECRELERDFGTKYTERLLEEGGEGVSTRYLKKCILESGRELLLASCAGKDKAPMVAKIGKEVGWEVGWDAALCGGVRAIRRMQKIVVALCHHCPDGPSPLSLCEWPPVRGDYETFRTIKLPNSISVVSFYLFCASVYFLCLCSIFVTFPCWGYSMNFEYTRHSFPPPPRLGYGSRLG